MDHDVIACLNGLGYSQYKDVIMTVNRKVKVVDTKLHIAPQNDKYSVLCITFHADTRDLVQFPRYLKSKYGSL